MAAPGLLPVAERFDGSIWSPWCCGVLCLLIADTCSEEPMAGMIGSSHRQKPTKSSVSALLQVIVALFVCCG
jgi:hypothetical protein